MIKRLLFFVASIVLIPSSVFAQSLADRVVEHTLSNGLKVLLVERPQVPIISFRIVYKVGSVNEVNGITGVAHLYEHMAFKGTKRIGTTDYKAEKELIKKIELVNDKISDEKRKGPEADRDRRACQS